MIALAYLNQRNIPHGPFQQGEVSTNGQLVFPDHHTEQGLIRNVRNDGLIRTDIEIQFQFDDTNSKLISYSVREVYTGP